MHEACLDEPEVCAFDDEWNEELDWLTAEGRPLDGDDREGGLDDADPRECSDEAMKRLRPRRKRKSTVVVPRLFKRDIRRHYATMLANVGNSHDYGLFYAFFRTYAVGDFVVKRHRAPTSQSISTATDYSCTALAARSGVHEIHGILSYAHAIYCSTQMQPDQVVAVHNVQVVTRPQCATSRVTFDMEVRFTHLYDIPPVLFMDNVFAVVDEYFAHLQGDSRGPAADGAAEGLATLSTPQLATHLGAEAVRPVVDPFQLCRQICGRPIRLCAKPVPIVVRAKTILHLDERRRIAVVEATDIAYQQ